MSEIRTWGFTGSPGNLNDASDNSLAPPNGFPEGMQYQGFNDSAREVMAAIARDVADTRGSLTSSGSGGAYEITANRTVVADDGLTFGFIANHDNGGGASTLEISGQIGVRPLLTPDGGSPTIVPDQIVVVSYSAALASWVMISDAGRGVALKPIDIVPGTRVLSTNDFLRRLRLSSPTNQLEIPTGLGVGNEGAQIEILFVLPSGTNTFGLINNSGGDIYDAAGALVIANGNADTFPEGYWRLVKLDGDDWMLVDF